MLDGTTSTPPNPASRLYMDGENQKKEARNSKSHVGTFISRLPKDGEKREKKPEKRYNMV